MRTIDLVERQIIIAKRKNQPRVIARLEAELAELKSKRPEPKEYKVPAAQKWEDLSLADQCAIINY